MPAAAGCCGPAHAALPSAAWVRTRGVAGTCPVFPSLGGAAVRGTGPDPAVGRAGAGVRWLGGVGGPEGAQP